MNINLVFQVNTCLADLSNQIVQGFKSGKSIGMILIEAFDTLDHDILLEKMKYLCFRTKTKAKHCCKP